MSIDEKSEDKMSINMLQRFDVGGQRFEVDECGLPRCRLLDVVLS